MISGKQPSHIDSAEFTAAKSAWESTERAFRALLNKRDSMALALSMASESDADRDRLKEAAEHVRKTREVARQYLTQALRRPELLVDKIRDIDDEIEEAHPKYIRAREDWENARSRETSRIAIELRERQRPIVRRIAKGLSALSTSIADAHALQAELARTAPNPTSVYLEDVTKELAHMALGDWASHANQWVRRMKAANLITDWK